MSKKITFIGVYLLLILAFTNCSGANFGGGDSEAVENSAQAHSDDDGDQPDNPLEPPPPLDGEAVVYQTSVINGGLSFDRVQVEVDIATSTTPVLLFVHLQQPTTILLKGDVESVAAIFLTSNTSAYDLPTSEVRLAGGTLFPSSRLATGFLPLYQAGNGLAGIIGDDAVATWEQGVIVSDFARNLGQRKCYDLVFDTDFAPPPSFSLSWSTGQNCIY